MVARRDAADGRSPAVSQDSKIIAGKRKQGEGNGDNSTSDSSVRKKTKKGKRDKTAEERKWEEGCGWREGHDDEGDVGDHQKKKGRNKGKKNKKGKCKCEPLPFVEQRKPEDSNIPDLLLPISAPQSDARTRGDRVDQPVFIADSPISLPDSPDTSRLRQDTSAVVAGDVIVNGVEVTDGDGEEGGRESREMLRLLRPPRYFTAEQDQAMCFVCGQTGHDWFNCPQQEQRQRPPCALCGKTGHFDRFCPQTMTCHRCNQVGHRARDCQASRQQVDRSRKETSRGRSASGQRHVCLKCGGEGHDYTTCRFDYNDADLAGIQCYVCGERGHLCCADWSKVPLPKPSCFECGEVGHLGQVREGAVVGGTEERGWGEGGEEIVIVAKKGNG